MEDCLCRKWTYKTWSIKSWNKSIIQCWNYCCGQCGKRTCNINWFWICFGFCASFYTWKQHGIYHQWRNYQNWLSRIFAFKSCNNIGSKQLHKIVCWSQQRFNFKRRSCWNCSKWRICKWSWSSVCIFL